MGRIVSTFFTTVEGGMQSSRAFLVGRRLYNEWSAYWPEAHLRGRLSSGDVPSPT